MVEVYPVRYILNYPNTPIDVRVVNLSSTGTIATSGGSAGYTTGYLTITTVPPGSIVFVTTITTHQMINLFWGILGNAITQTIYLNIIYSNMTVNLALNGNVLPGYFYEQAIVLPGPSTIGISFSNTSTITVVYGVIY